MKHEQEPEGFDAWWAIWRPHRRKSDARDKACEAFRKAVLRGADPDALAVAARWHIDHLSERDRPYIQLAASYLNGGGWKDDLADKADYEARIAKARERASQPSNVQQLRPSDYKTPFLRAYEAQQAKEA